MAGPADIATSSATDEGTFGLWLEGQITLEGLLEVGPERLCALQADGKPDEAIGNAQAAPQFRVKIRMCR